ncbi:hypothetical protein NDU88_002878 [Pleurodeles waltl]|uniref:Uncharacterized protein n=1 Tax=Pleurodeles waltl TaxID=8319 RepID=A0AAV7T375_PLEWA|nr:hypothetical protein NDU88_002878 [Pleurodeles waltl]
MSPWRYNGLPRPHSGSQASPLPAAKHFKKREPASSPRRRQHGGELLHTPSPSSPGPGVHRALQDVKGTKMPTKKKSRAPGSSGPHPRARGQTSSGEENLLTGPRSGPGRAAPRAAPLLAADALRLEAARSAPKPSGGSAQVTAAVGVPGGPQCDTPGRPSGIPKSQGGRARTRRVLARRHLGHAPAWLSDFNCVLDRFLDREPPRQDTKSHMTAALKGVMDNLGLVAMWRTLHTMQWAYTCH